MSEEPYLFRLKEGTAVNGTLYNLSGDYTYLTAGYYRCLDCELAGAKVKPTTEEVLDAYIVPLALHKAEQKGLKTLPHEIVNGDFSPPVLAYPLNPFTSKWALIENENEVKAKTNSLTMGGKYAMLCQFLPHDYVLTEFVCIFGRTADPRFHWLAGELYAAFQLPLMKVRVVESGGEVFFSAIEPITIKEMVWQDRALLEESGKWQE